MAELPISERLLSCAKLVRAGAHFADIGTDHAYLPIFLLNSGVIESAVCSDVNSGPLKTAERNAREAGLYDKMKFILSDGADKLSGLGITDVAICGMGGELIADIVTRAEFFRVKGFRLILQPMSKSEVLRETILSLGFTVLSEVYSCDAGKYYVSILCEYTGEVEEWDEVRLSFGSLPKREELTSAALYYLKARERALHRRIEGKRLGGEDYSYEERLYSFLSRYLEK